MPYFPWDIEILHLKRCEWVKRMCFEKVAVSAEYKEKTVAEIIAHKMQGAQWAF